MDSVAGGTGAADQTVAAAIGAAGTSAGVFLSYRRGDPRARVGRLYDRLVARFPGRVFRDIDTIVPAENFRVAIDEALGRTRVLIAVIGPQWATVTDERGRRRLDDPQDFVRYEVERALANPRCRVLPVLAGGAVMPRAGDLPPSLAPVTELQAVTVADDEGPHFEFDARQVGDAVATLLAEPMPGPSLELDLPERDVVAEPGGEARLPVLIRNTGTGPADVALGWEGPGWLSLSPTDVHVPAGQSLTAEVVARPPRSVPAQRWEVAVSARVAQQPPLRGEGSVTTLPFFDTAVGLEPAIVATRGRTAHLSLTVANGGNATLEAQVRGSGPGLTADVVPSVSVGPFGQATFPVTATATRRRPFGRPVEHPLEIEVTPAGQPPLVCSAQVRQVPAVSAPAALVSLVVLAGVLALGWWLLRPQGTVLPDVTDATEAAALGTLARAGYDDVAVQREPSGAEAPGEVLRTDPPPGTAAPIDQRVVLVVAEKATSAEIPDVRAFTEDGAVAALKEDGFTDVTVDHRKSADAEPGDVLGTDPAAGTEAAFDDPVTVLIAAAAEKLYEVPDVSGLTWDQAWRKYPGPLDVFDKYEPSDTVDKGRVTRQDPPPGTKHPAGTNVDVYLSTGPTTSPTEAKCSFAATGPASATVSCTSFAPGESVGLTVDGGSGPDGTADADGAVQVAVDGLGAGEHQVTATGGTSGRVASVSGEVTG